MCASSRRPFPIKEGGFFIVGCIASFFAIFAPEPFVGIVLPRPFVVMANRQIVKEAAVYIVKYDVRRADERKAVVPWKRTVVDPENRDRQFVKPDAAVDKGRKIFEAGFVAEKARVILLELPTDPTARGAVISLNEEKARQDTRLPTVDVGAAAFSCLGGNHLGIFSRMVLQGVQIKGFCAEGSEGQECLSLHALQRMDPEFGKAVVDGVACTVLSQRMRVEEPRALHIIQAMIVCIMYFFARVGFFSYARPTVC